MATEAIIAYLKPVGTCGLRHTAMKIFCYTTLVASLLSIGLEGASGAVTYISGAVGNGDFQAAPAGQTLFSSGNVPSWTNWSDYDSQTNDTGVTAGANRVAFLQPDGAAGSTGPNVGTGGAIRSTVTTLTGEGSAAGTVFTYSFSTTANASFPRGTASMVLLYNNAGIWTEVDQSFLRGGLDNAATNPAGGSYSRTFTVNAGDAWENKAITVGFRHSLATDDTGVVDAVNGSEFYPEIDNVVFSSVPEPSVALLGGLGMLALLRRRRA